MRNIYNLNIKIGWYMIFWIRIYVWINQWLIWLKLLFFKWIDSLNDELLIENKIKRRQNYMRFRFREVSWVRSFMDSLRYWHPSAPIEFFLKMRLKKWLFEYQKRIKYDILNKNQLNKLVFELIRIDMYYSSKFIL